MPGTGSVRSKSWECLSAMHVRYRSARSASPTAWLNSTSLFLLTSTAPLTRSRCGLLAQERFDVGEGRRGDG